MLIRCMNCGKDNRSDSKRCVKCERLLSLRNTKEVERQPARESDPIGEF